MIEESYVTFETAKLLKEKGFDGVCRAGYSSHGTLNDIEIKEYLTNKTCTDSIWECVAPTQQMAMRWLREVHKLACNIDCMMPLGPTYKYYIYYLDSENKHTDFKHYNTYEECAENAIKYSLENLIK